MLITTVVNSSVATVRLEGKFTFDQHREFRNVTKKLIEGTCKDIEIDFAKVDYLDSSALGLLLLAREWASNSGKAVSLVNCTGVVKQVLNISNFKRLFSIR